MQQTLCTFPHSPQLLLPCHKAYIWQSWRSKTSARGSCTRGSWVSALRGQHPISVPHAKQSRAVLADSRTSRVQQLKSLPNFGGCYDLACWQNCQCTLPLQHFPDHLQLLPSEAPIAKGRLKAFCQSLICELLKWRYLKRVQALWQVEVAAECWPSHMRWLDGSCGVVVLSITIVLIIERLQNSCTWINLPFVMFKCFEFIRKSPQDIILWYHVMMTSVY